MGVKVKFVEIHEMTDQEKSLYHIILTLKGKSISIDGGCFPSSLYRDLCVSD